MDFESPDVEKDFPGLYASDPSRQSQERDSDISDGEHDKPSKKDLLIGRRRDKRESKKDKGYIAFEGESSEEEMDSEQKSPSKGKKTKSAFKFSKKDKSKDKDKPKDREVKEEKKEKKESKVKLKLKDKKKTKHMEEETDKDDKTIFGVPLVVAVARNKCHDGVELPAIVRECIDYIEEHGLSCEGIYRLSGVKSKVQKLRSQYNNGDQVYLHEYEPHIVASLLKQFLREIPDPVLTSSLMSQFEDSSGIKDAAKRMEVLKKLINELPSCNRTLLSWIFAHMRHIIEREKQNKMNVQNVSIVLSPTMQISHRVINAFFTHNKELFGDTVLKKYVPPLKPETSRTSLELPDSPAAIEEELCKQESLLSQLHAQLNAGLVDHEKEELLWEVQRVVTQLKRKLRFAKRLQETDERGLKIESDDGHIDTRLKELPDELSPSPTVAQVESEHKCKVYVSWNGDNKNQQGFENSSQHVSGYVETYTNVSTCIPVSEHNEVDAAVDLPVISKENVSTLAVSNIEVIPSSSHSNPDGQDRITDVAKENCDFDDAEMQLLLKDEQLVAIQQEELQQLGEELRRKIETERSEVDKLKTKIKELQNRYCYQRLSGGSSENSSDINSSDSDEEEDEDNEDNLQQILVDLLKENQELEIKNSELIRSLQIEREACLEVKVQLRLIQQRQNEALQRHHSEQENTIY